MFVVKNDNGKNDHESYKSIYFNYFLISHYRVKLFLAMQVRVMAACMESQSNIGSAQSRPRDGRGVSEVYGVVLHFLIFSIWNQMLVHAAIIHRRVQKHAIHRTSFGSHFSVFISIAPVSVVFRPLPPPSIRSATIVLLMSFP